MNLSIIKEVYRKRSEENEGLRKDVLEEVFNALDRLSEEVSFEEAYIFGSVTEPHRFNRFSDVDIAFKALDKDRLFYVTAFLSGLLERDVNIIELESIHFRDKIEKRGILWKKG